MKKEEQLLTYLQEIVFDITEVLAKSDLTKDEQVENLISQIQSLLMRFELKVEDLVPTMIMEEFFGGVIAANNALVDTAAIATASSSGAITAATGTAAATAAAAASATGAITLGTGGKVAKEFMRPAYTSAAEKLSLETMSDLKAAIRMAGASSKTTITETLEAVKSEMVKGTIQGEPRKVIQAAVAERFKEEGLTSFLTKPDVNGVQRRLPLDFYAMTVTRYKTREAATNGATTRYDEAGQDLVEIVENADTCKVCSRYKGMVVSLKGNTPGFPKVGENGITLPPYHPNCRGNVRPYVLKFKSDEEVAEKKKHNDKYHPELDRRSTAMRKEYEKEQRLRRQVNKEKLEFMEMNAALGDKNYKTLGAYRRAKRKRSKRYLELRADLKRSKKLGQSNTGE